MELSREDKALLGVSAVAALAIGTISIVLARRKKKVSKKSYGLKVGAQCSTYEFTDQTRAQETIAQLVDRAATKGAIDPFSVTTGWLRAAAGQCNAYPKQTRNPGEAALYRDIFYEVIEAMRERLLLSEQTEQTYRMMVDTWAASQGVEVGPA